MKKTIIILSLFLICENVSSQQLVVNSCKSNVRPHKSVNPKEMVVELRWTPIIPKPRDPVTYRVLIFEGSVDNVERLLNMKPIASSITSSEESNISIFCSPPSLPCPRDLTWVVEALDQKNAIVARSNPNAIKNKPTTSEFRWTPIIPKPRDPVKY